MLFFLIDMNSINLPTTITPVFSIILNLLVKVKVVITPMYLTSDQVTHETSKRPKRFGLGFKFVKKAIRTIEILIKSMKFAALCFKFNYFR